MKVKTIRFIVDFFSDGCYKLLLSTRLDYRNVWLDKDGTITICFTDDDNKTLEKLPRLYRDINNLNNELRFMRRNILKDGK